MRRELRPAACNVKWNRYMPPAGGNQEQASTVALRFVERINARDVAGLVALMTPDHVFTDSLGAEVVGAERMAEAWRTYFSLMPRYHIDVEQSIADGAAVALIGVAEGVYGPAQQAGADGRWSTPAAWLTTIRDGCVARWRVFADNRPVYRLMASFPPADSRAAIE